MHAVRIASAAVAVLVSAACADPVLNLEELGASHPELAGLDGHRLAEVRPYYLPAAGSLVLFLCRWPDGASIPVELPADADADEQRKLSAALDAWQGAGLGVRFELTRAGLGGVGIEIRLRDGMLASLANTVVDCGVEAEGIVAGADPLPARVVFASIHLARGDPRLAGAALHELGHALGFQGHPRPPRHTRVAPRAPRTVMVRGTEAVRLAGERVLAGRPFSDSTLSALYAVPSGTVLRRLALRREHTEPVDRMLAIGRRLELVGPLVRVGDTEGLIAWYDPDTGAPASLRLGGLEQARTRPERLTIEPSSSAQRLLDGP
jgi:hypothetical protein